MSRIASCVAELTGHTSLVRTNPLITTNAHVIVKLEAFNPAPLMKDRIVAPIINVAEASDKLSLGGTIIGATPGSTGIALATAGVIRGYKVAIVMPESMSVERRIIVRVFGAELVLIDPKGGVAAAVVEAERIHDERPGSIVASQFDNPANPAAHVATTGEKIWADTGGQVDVFVAGIGTGGTISGIAKPLKAKNPNVMIIAVQPVESPLLTGGSAGPHGIQGLMPNSLPGNYDASLINGVVSVKTVEASKYVRRAAAEEGLFVRIFSGAMLAGTVPVTAREESAGKMVVTLLPGTGERYLPTVLFDDLRG